MELTSNRATHVPFFSSCNGKAQDTVQHNLLWLLSRCAGVGAVTTDRWVVLKPAVKIGHCLKGAWKCTCKRSRIHTGFEWRSVILFFPDKKIFHAKRKLTYALRVFLLQSYSVCRAVCLMSMAFLMLCRIRYKRILFNPLIASWRVYWHWKHSAVQMMTQTCGSTTCEIR